MFQQRPVEGRHGPPAHRCSRTGVAGGDRKRWHWAPRRLTCGRARLLPGTSSLQSLGASERGMRDGSQEPLGLEHGRTQGFGPEHDQPLGPAPGLNSGTSWPTLPARWLKTSSRGLVRAAGLSIHQPEERHCQRQTLRPDHHFGTHVAVSARIPHVMESHCPVTAHHPDTPRAVLPNRCDLPLFVL